MPLSVTPSPTYAGTDPTFVAAYIHSITDVSGVVAANNYYVLYNPASSTHLVIVEGVTLEVIATGTVTSASSMLVYRISGAPTGGTQVTGPNINRFYTGFPDPQAQIFVGNPTVTTVGNPLIGFHSALGSASGANSDAAPVPAASFVLLPGQGVVWRQLTGSTNHMWNIQMVWGEKLL